MKVGQKFLITTDNWFIAPDGKQYRAVWGTVKAVKTDTDVLGIKTNARPTNWYVQIGNMVVAGCQIHYAVQADEVELGSVREFSVVDGVCKEYRRPTNIYSADGQDE